MQAEEFFLSKQYECVEIGKHFTVERDIDDTLYIHFDFPSRPNLMWKMITQQASRLFEFDEEILPTQLGNSTIEFIYKTGLGKDFPLTLFYDYVSMDLSAILRVPVSQRVVHTLFEKAEDVTESNFVQFYANVLRELKAEQDVARIFCPRTLLGNYSH